MSFLLDTNVVIGLLAGKPVLISRARLHPQSALAVPSLVIAELCYGAYRGRNQTQSMLAIRGLPFRVLEFDGGDAWQAGEIRAALAAKGRPIGAIDSLIAGQARARGLILVTHNTAEFARVDGLRVEDWET